MTMWQVQHGLAFRPWLLTAGFIFPLSGLILGDSQDCAAESRPLKRKGVLVSSSYHVLFSVSPSSAAFTCADPWLLLGVWEKDVGEG